jgi:hypothetical protein
MVEVSTDATSGHDGASEGSRSLCDQLFDGVRQNFDGIKRNMGRNYCDFYEEGEKRFAYVRHLRRASRLEVWFRGPDTLAARFPELDIRERSATNSGWAVFNLYFRVNHAAEIQPASDLLALIASGRGLDKDPGAEASLDPDEITDSQLLTEGAVRKVCVNAFERNPKLRKLCIDHWKDSCIICNFNFGRIYGPIVEGFIHVHHRRSLSAVRSEHEVNPKDDLCPLCPNCHAVVHSRIPPYTVEQVRAFLDQRGK